MKIKLLLLLSCMGASVCAMQAPLTIEDVESNYPEHLNFLLNAGRSAQEREVSPVDNRVSVEVSKETDHDQDSDFYACTHPGCDFWSADPVRSKAHAKKHGAGTKRRLESTENTQITKKALPRVYLCNNEGCGRAFAVDGWLKKHTKSCKFTSNQQAQDPVYYPCTNSGCDYAAVDAQDNQQHQQTCIHKTVKQRLSFACPECKDFTTANLIAFKKHKDTCGVEEPTFYNCKYPNCSFITNKGLTDCQEHEKACALGKRVNAARLQQLLPPLTPPRAEVAPAEVVTPLTPPSPVRAPVELPIVTEKSQTVINDFEYAAQSAQVDEDSYAEYLSAVACNHSEEEAVSEKAVRKPRRVLIDSDSEVEAPVDAALKSPKQASSDDEFTKQCIERWKKQAEARALKAATKNYFCECGRAYNRKFDLTKHKKSHKFS